MAFAFGVILPVMFLVLPLFVVDIAGVLVLYTGDYSREEDRHLRAAVTPEFSLDICIIESTYGVQLNMPHQIREKLFTDVIHSTLMQGGRVLIPIYYASPLARCMADLHQCHE